MNDLKYPIEVTPELVASFYKGGRRSLSFSLLFKSKFAYVAAAFNRDEELLTEAMTLSMERMVGESVSDFTELIAKVLINPSTTVLYRNRKHYEEWSNRESLYVLGDDAAESLSFRTMVVKQHKMFDEERNYIPVNNLAAGEILERYLSRNYRTDLTGSKGSINIREMTEKLLRQSEGTRQSSKAELIGFSSSERAFIRRLAKRDEQGFRAAIKAAMEAE
jgi:hypothetical protein